MALDPEARAVLDQMTAAGFPALHDLTVERARALMSEMAMIAPPEPVTHVDDVMLPGPEGGVPARIYRPADGPLPVLVWFHGGGWVIGSVDDSDGTARTLANRTGFVVISVDYRLAPEHKFPAAPEDCYAATGWAATHAREHGGDPARLCVGGDSAGGNLAAAVCLMARDRGGPPLSFQALVYPVTDHAFDTPSYRDNADGYLLTRDAMRWFWGHYLRSDTDGTNPYAAPLRAPSLAGLPPAMVVTAEYDPLRDEGEAYGNRLAAEGVATEVRRYDGMIHGFFSMSVAIGAAKQAVDDVAAALRTAVGS